MEEVGNGAGKRGFGGGRKKRKREEASHGGTERTKSGIGSCLVLRERNEHSSLFRVRSSPTKKEKSNEHSAERSVLGSQ